MKCIRTAVRTVFTLTALTVSAIAADINASLIATGTETFIDWTALKPVVGGVTAFQASTRAIADIGSQPSAYYLPTPWGAAWNASLESPVLNRTKATPAATPQLIYKQPYVEQASIDSSTTPRSVLARAAKKGDASGKISHTVKFAHTGATPADYFMTLIVPVQTFSFVSAFNFCCIGDSNGGTYVFIKPTNVSMRTTADVIVNGLPVWSAEKQYRYTEAYATYASDKVETNWGRTADSGTNRIYLGRLSQGQSLTVSLITRADSIVNANTCGTANWGWGSTPEANCTEGTAKVTTATMGGYLPFGMTIFARTL